jgi:hypothetical protein
MTTSENYRRFAVRCLEEARNTPEESRRAFLVEMAQQWQKLADHATANDNLNVNPVPEEPDLGD